MGIYNTSGSALFESGSTIDGNLNVDELLESYIYDEISRLPDEKRQEFVQSEAAQVMLEKGYFRKNTLVRLNKEDDLSRRLKMACLQMAKDNDDPLWNKLTANRVKERDLLDAITNKYSNKAGRVAKMGQKEFLKNKIPVGYMR